MNDLNLYRNSEREVQNESDSGKTDNNDICLNDECKCQIPYK